MLKCFYCKKKGHFQKDFRNFFSRCEKKGISITCVCFENNFVDVPNKTWWIDTGATSHVDNSLHGFQNKGKPSDERKGSLWDIMWRLKCPLLEPTELGSVLILSWIQLILLLYLPQSEVFYLFLSWMNVVIHLSLLMVLFSFFFLDPLPVALLLLLMIFTN